jgi:hypothetical protein
MADPVSARLKLEWMNRFSLIILKEKPFKIDLLWDEFYYHTFFSIQLPNSKQLARQLLLLENNNAKGDLEPEIIPA